MDTATNFRTDTTGLNTVDLRNLGDERALVLVNGRRHIGGSAGSTTVDVSSIPAALVSRVEIVTGGASAVYGSEAIAGVVNFIMKDRFEGVEVNGRAGTSEAGGAKETDFSVLAGNNFANDRGNAVVYVGYSKRGILASSQRELSAHDATNSSYGPKGHFFAPGFAGGQGWTQDDTTSLFNKPFVAAEDGFDRNQIRLIRVPSERLQFNGNLSYQINDNLKFINETSYTQLTASSRLEPTITGQQISIGSIENITVPLNNPFLPNELRTLIVDASRAANIAAMAKDPTVKVAAPPDHAILFRRFVELGPRTSDVQRKTFRTVSGLEGSFALNNHLWDYEIYYQYGNNSQDQTNGGVFNTLNFYNALNVEADPANAGEFRCQDAIARSLGCVPLNVFGADSITGAALDWVRVNSQLTTRMTQHVAGSSIAGTAFALPAGDVGVALGAEWRKEKSTYNSDTLAASGLTSGNSTPNTAGDYSVWEIYAETLIPILHDMPGANYFGLELAARYSDYTTIGNNWAYKASIDWRPYQDLKVRGGYSTAIRAPAISDLFNPGSETFRSFVDPCAFGGLGGTSADGKTTYSEQPAAAQANCATIPGTATLDPGAINIRSAGGLSAGNPALNEEKANTWTFGAVFTPKQVNGLSVTVDYFNIEITDAIGAFTAQVTLDQCLRQPGFPGNSFCGLIQRNPTTGLVERVNALSLNAAELAASGIDFAVDYSTSFYTVSLNLNLNGTYTDKYESLPFVGGEVVDDLGEVGVPKWKINATATFGWNDLQVGWSARYIDGVMIDNDNPTFGTIDPYFYHDLQVRYSIDRKVKYEMFAGVDNVFNKKPPFLAQGVNGAVTGTNTAADVYDVLLRYGYVGLKVSF